MSPALQSGLLTSGPPVKSPSSLYDSQMQGRTQCLELGVLGLPKISFRLWKAGMENLKEVFGQPEESFVYPQNEILCTR